ncbi:MAG: transposase, partial [Chloroflexi bacterium]|nr:transposase [Chloroflexota bacterium]
PKEGALHHGYTQVRGYHPLLSIAAGTADVLMARLREGRANTARGAAHFLHETIGRVRGAGATGQLTMRADSDLQPPKRWALGWPALASQLTRGQLGLPGGRSPASRRRAG